MLGEIDRVANLLSDAVHAAIKAESLAEVGLAGAKRDRVIASLKAARQAGHEARCAVDDARYDGRIER